MDGNIPEMKLWSHPHPKISWILIGLLGMVGLLPFFAGIFIIALRTPFSSFVDSSQSPLLLAATFFTIKQAALTTIMVGLLSPVFGLGLVFLSPRMLRASFIVRTLIFCLPSLVVATGIILAWGNNGLATRSLENFGIFIPIPALVYSPYAIVLANTLMNLPFASLMIFRSLIDLPGEQIECAVLMGLRPMATYRNIFWPAIKPVLLYFSGMTFLLSLTSFGALSILGGGPASQTLELGIYQSIYLDADWASAAIFSMMHTVLAAFVAIIFVRPQFRWLDSSLSRLPPAALNLEKLKLLISNHVAIRRIFVSTNFALDLFVLLPIVALVGGTLSFLDSTHQAPNLEAVLDSLKVSLGYAIPSATSATIIAWLVSRSFCRYKLYEQPKYAMMMLASIFGAAIIPGMAAAFGFLVLRTMLPAYFFGSPAIISLHTTIMIPILVNILLPVYSQKLMPFEGSRVLLGLSNFRWLMALEWRTMKIALASPLAIGLALSINETSVVSMLGDPLHPALTTAVIRMMGHYRFGEASLVASLLIFTSLTTIVLLSPRRGLSNDAA